MTARAKDGEIRVGNRAITAAWNYGPSGLRWHSLEVGPARPDLMLTGEVFEVELSDGSRFPASALRAMGGPVVRRHAPDRKAASLADRLPGRQVELTLESSDGRLAFQWRAIGLDGANYLRQELDLTAARGDVTVREVVWFNQSLPGARTLGRVDGSPVVAGDLFLGYEDPMSVNTAVGPERVVGEWAPADLDPQQRRRKTWSLSAGLLHPGTNEFTFRYTHGPHRLDVWRVALRVDGAEVAVDEHHGHTGTAHVNQVYRLNVPASALGPAELTAELSTDPDFRVPAGSGVESYGKVWLGGGPGPVHCRLVRNATLRRGETLTQSFVVGVAPPGQMRRAFLHYLERERAHPYRPFLHYNSWYDIAWAPFALNETNCLEAIRLFGERFIQPHDAVIDAMVFDDGWDDPRTLWQFHRGFPNGFAPLASLARRYGTRVGVWLSPFGGYGEPREQRLRFGSAQGFETNATGFSLAGPKYYAAFKRACLDMIRQYDVNHFKFDGIASGMYADGSGADYILDTEAMRRLMLELRDAAPDLYINLTTGSWPSPFWLRYADSLWRQGGDMGFAGKGTRQQQWLTYRDQEVYRNVVGKGPLFPLNSLMTQGVAYSRQGYAGDPTFDSKGFKDDVRAFFGGGTGLQELYIQPDRLTADDWAVLAEAARWSRARADVLVDTHWIGGDPSAPAVYGYASWTPRQGIVMLRNPDDRPREFQLEVGQAFELPPGAPRRYTLRRPWAEDRHRPALVAEAGHPLRLELAPFEVLILETDRR